MHRGHEQPNRNAGNNQFLRFAQHVLLDGLVKRQEMPRRTHDALPVAKHEKQRKDQNEQVDKKRKQVFHEDGKFFSEERGYFFRALPQWLGNIHGSPTPRKQPPEPPATATPQPLLL